MEQIIRQRRSSRNFDENKHIEPGIVNDLLEAAKMAPSSRNLQPWQYIVFDHRTPKMKTAMEEILSPGNQRWAPSAPLFILSMAQTKYQGNDYPVGLHDLGLANQNLMLQAIAHGLSIRPMGGFDKQKARSILQIPDHLTPVALFAIGYPGEMEDLDPEIREREQIPRQRKDINEFSYLGSFDNPNAVNTS